MVRGSKKPTELKSTATDFQRIDNNPIPYLADLRAHASFGDVDTKEVDVRLDLWFGEEEIYFGNHSAKLKIRKGVIVLALCGYKVVPGSRFGAATSANETSVKETYKAVSSSRIGVKANLSTDFKSKGVSASLSSNAEGILGGSKLNTIEFKMERLFIKVRSAGNDTWIVSEIDNRAIEEQVLDNALLCRLDPINNANRQEIRIFIKVKKDDFSISYSSTIANLSINKRQVLGALLLKSLNENKQDIRGALTLSQSEICYE